MPAVKGNNPFYALISLNFIIKVQELYSDGTYGTKTIVSPKTLSLYVPKEEMKIKAFNKALDSAGNVYYHKVRSTLRIEFRRK
jgi:hypothetical protein